MIVIDCEQGSPEWKAARLGIPTASQFHRIITPKTGKLSAQGRGYRYELLAAWLLGRDVNDVSSGFMERGSEMEAEACAYYEFQKDSAMEYPGFLLRDDRTSGCSPDALVGEHGGLEIKCLSAANHIGALLSPPDPAEHICQIQGSLWITGRQWWDRLYYHPMFPKLIVRFERDMQFIYKLSTAVEQFVDSISEGREKLRDMGCEPQELLQEVA